MSQPIPEGFELQSKVAELEDLIKEKHPKMPTLLREIHRTLQQYPEQVTILSEEEIAVIVQGLQIQTGTELAKDAAKPSATKAIKNKISNLGVDAF
jgi:hypothetical protein